MVKLSRTSTFALITILILLWGMSFPIYKAVLSYSPPLLFAGIRTLLGGILLTVILLRWRSKIRWRQNWPIYSISGLLNVVLFFGLQTIGLNYLPAGLFSVIVYLQPVLVGLFAWLWLGEWMSGLKIVGFMLGFVGVVIVSMQGIGGEMSLPGILLGLGTALSWGVGTVYVKKVSAVVDSMWLAALQCIIGGMILTGAGLVWEPWSSITWNSTLLFGMLYGSIVGVAASWTIYFTLVNSGDAGKVASYTFLVPFVSVACGNLFLKEAFSIYLIVGLLFIAVSIFFVNRKPKLLHAGLEP
jgi:drug/metabolite transporter (DMT)-like permease